jgi:hypothetical protein
LCAWQPPCTVRIIAPVFRRSAVELEALASDAALTEEGVGEFKFGRLTPDGQDVEFRYADVYDWERTTGPARLVVAPASGQIDLLLALAECWRGPFGVLYVLVVPRGGGQAGRYQTPEPLMADELRSFLAAHRDFLEGDARHALWVASATGEGTLVYDRHNVIYAYGPLEAFEDVLRARGIRRGPVRFPVPHSHHYRPEFDPAERRLLSVYDWIRTPLRPDDQA